MPLVVACLVPAAPALLPALTGDRVPEVAPVRDAVARAVAALAGLDRVVVVAPRLPGTLAGFGAPGAPAAPAPLGSWPHGLAAQLLAGSAGAPADRVWLSWDDDGLASGLEAAAAASGRTGLLLLADGSRTRGPRAPGGEDRRGEAVDAELVAALRAGRPAVVPDAVTVGATAAPAVRLLADLAGARPGAVDLLHADAPLGVCYLVAVGHAAPGPAAPAGSPSTAAALP